MSARLKYAASALIAAATVTTALVVKWEPAPGDRMFVAIQPIPGDRWTICYGHTKGVYEGMRATQAQCDRWREEDIAEAMEHVALCIEPALTPNQLGALADGVVNLGPKLVCGSTLQRKANAGDFEGMCRELTDALNSDGRRRGWSFAQGRFWPGLYARRTAERAICWPDFSNVRGGAL